MFLAMEYERESSRTACSVVPTPSEVEEGVYIVSFEIWPLTTCHVSFLLEIPGQPDHRPERPVQGPVGPGQGPDPPVQTGWQTGPRPERRSVAQYSLRLASAQSSVGAGAPGRASGPTGPVTGLAGPNRAVDRTETGGAEVSSSKPPGWHERRGRLAPGRPAVRPVNRAADRNRPAHRPVQPGH